MYYSKKDRLVPQKKARMTHRFRFYAKKKNVKIRQSLCLKRSDGVKKNVVEKAK